MRFICRDYFEEAYYPTYSVRGFIRGLGLNPSLFMVADNSGSYRDSLTSLGYATTIGNALR